LQSPQWQVREAALEEIIQEIATVYGKKEGFEVAFNQLVKMSMDQKINQIIIQTVNLIEAIILTQP
jgi:type IV secretory pathway ATPase VirB11/archaellum biosynthesis ATPase